MGPLFGAAYAAPNKGTTILYRFRSPKTVLNPPVNGKIQGLLRPLSVFPVLFKAIFYFQGLFKTILYIQVLFEPVRTLSLYLLYAEFMQESYQNRVAKHSCSF